MKYFCTYFDSRYLPRGLALVYSLRSHVSAFQLWVLCLDRECYQALKEMNLPEVHLISLEAFEEGDEALLTAKQTRTQIEYYFTCTASLLLFVFKQSASVDLLTYVDADLFFFSDPTPAFSEMDGASVAITEHRFSEGLRHLEQYGRYNVGWLSFRRDASAMKCLQWWREKCLEWCYDRCEDDRFADQKYLDVWPERFSGVMVLRHKGVNVGPWNVSGADLRMLDGRVMVETDPLICFHFHNLKQVNTWVFQSNFADYHVTANAAVRNHVYRPYVQSLVDHSRYVTSLKSLKISASTDDIRNIAADTARRPWPVRFRQWVVAAWGTCRDLVFRRCFLVIQGKVI